MKKLVIMGLATATTLSSLHCDEGLLSGKPSGQMRVAHISQKYEGDRDTYGTSFGGILKYETAVWNNVKLGAAAFISQKMRFASGDDDQNELNEDFFDIDGKSYAYVGEAYIDYSAYDFNLRVGRQRIDTPFFDTDDIRMHPNTFEALIASYSGIDGSTFVGGYVTRWAGYDSEDTISKDKFKKLSENSSGAAIVGIMNESVKNLAFQGWYYHIDELFSAVYADATYTIPFSGSMGLELSAQYAAFFEKRESGVDGNVLGIGAAFNIETLTLGAAYNESSNDEGKSISNGFGGGPYITSMEEWTIEGMNDVKAYQLSAEVDMAIAGLDGITMKTQYGHFKTNAMIVQEWDVIAASELSEALSADISYAKIDDKYNNADGGDDAGYSRFLVRLSYNF